VSGWRKEPKIANLKKYREFKKGYSIANKERECEQSGGNESAQEGGEPGDHG